MLIDKNDEEQLTEADYNAVSELIQKSRDHSITHMITISTTLASVYNNIAFAQKFPEVSAAVGLHPCDYGTNWKEEIAHIRNTVSQTEYRSSIVAIGECGLDYHHPGYDADEQKAVFEAQIELALEHNLPIIVHSRKATEASLRIIEPYLQNGIRGVIHCYGGDAGLAQDICNQFGFYIGIAGPVTYPKNDGLREAVQTVGIDNILLETDAPFLPPQVIRGKRNHPLYIETIAHCVSNILELPLQTVAERTTANARDLCNITE